MDPVDLKAKEKEINLVLSEQPRVNLWKLRELALTEGGLVNGTLRYVTVRSFVLDSVACYTGNPNLQHTSHDDVLSCLFTTTTRTNN